MDFSNWLLVLLPSKPKEFTLYVLEQGLFKICKEDKLGFFMILCLFSLNLFLISTRFTCLMLPYQLQYFSLNNEAVCYNF